MLHTKEIRFALAIGLIAVTVGPTPAMSTTITFNEYPALTIVTNQYASVGALFSVSGVTSATIVDITADNGFNPTPYGPLGLRIVQGSPWDDFLSVEFVDPTDQNIPAFMTSVSFSFVSDDAGVGSITAFDDIGNMVDQAISALSGNPGVYETLTVTGTAIRSVHIDGFADVIIDQITFTSVPTPLPAAFPLFATGLGALGLLGWRRKRKKVAAMAAA